VVTMLATDCMYIRLSGHQKIHDSKVIFFGKLSMALKTAGYMVAW